MDPALSPGSRLGRYQVEELIGRGGMGAVYRARDPQLARLVAIKTLAPTSDDPDLARRFASEARLVGTLDHPNLLVVYDVGHDDGVAYLVSELLEGETLREHLASRGALTARDALAFALQAARGLAAAHAAGIVHRDLKPENLFLTRDGRVKILDFGIAKRVVVPGSATDAGITALTVSGAIVGTIGYMAPEQVLGEAIDARTDVFALGVVLQEMLTGTAPFRRETAIATLNAIVSDEAPPLPDGLSPALAGVVVRCLAKAPARRFQSAHDVAVALEVIEAIPSGVRQWAAPVASPPTVVSRRSLLVTGSSAAASFVAGGFGGAWLARDPSAAAPSYKRLTFRRGVVRSARLAPDGQTMVYGALWDTDACRVYTARLDGTESGVLNTPEANLLAISRSGELALSLGAHRQGIVTYGTLARLPMTGGTPRALLTDVKCADWSPDGAELAVVRRVDGRDRLEYPLGTVLLDPPVGSFTGIGFARVSADGRAVAYVRYRDPGSLIGYVAVIERGGTERRLTQESVNTHGLSWHGDDVWFTAADDAPLFRAIRAVGARGAVRVVTRLPGNVTLWDAHTDGRLLLAHTDDRAVLISRRPVDLADRDLSWLDASWCADLSADGSQLLFTETGQGGGPFGSAYLRGTDASPAVRLTAGMAYALSPDGQWALCSAPDVRVGVAAPGLVLVPTGPGETRHLDLRGYLVQNARFLPDGRGAVVQAHLPTARARLLQLDFASGTLTPITDDTAWRWALSPDGRRVATKGSSGGIDIVDLKTGAAHPLSGSTGADEVVGWIDDGVLVARADANTLGGAVDHVNPETGARAPWADLTPQDHAGIMARLNVAATRDGRSRAYSWHRALSSLYLASGLA